MAKLLNVTETQVKIWFQNRRTKWKKQDNISNAEAAEHKNQNNPKSSSSSSNQVKSGSSSSSKQQQQYQSKDIEASSDSNNSLLVSDGGNSVPDSISSRTAQTPEPAQDKQDRKIGSRDLVAGKGQSRIDDDNVDYEAGVTSLDGLEASESKASPTPPPKTPTEEEEEPPDDEAEDETNPRTTKSTSSPEPPNS